MGQKRRLGICWTSSIYKHQQVLKATHWSKANGSSITKCCSWADTTTTNQGCENCCTISLASSTSIASAISEVTSTTNWFAWFVQRLASDKANSHSKASITSVVCSASAISVATGPTEDKWYLWWYYVDVWQACAIVANSVKLTSLAIKTRIWYFFIHWCRISVSSSLKQQL